MEGISINSSVKSRFLQATLNFVRAITIKAVYSETWTILMSMCVCMRVCEGNIDLIDFRTMDMGLWLMFSLHPFSSTWLHDDGSH